MGSCWHRPEMISIPVYLSVTACRACVNCQLQTALLYRTCPRRPLNAKKSGGAYSALPDPLAGGEGALLPKNPTPAFGGLSLRPSRPQTGFASPYRPPTFSTVDTPMLNKIITL